MATRFFDLVAVVPQGTIAIGGYSKTPLGYDQTHARDKNGRSLIPATSLRGALRENLEAVLRAAGKGACVRGTGLSASHQPDEPYIECILGEDEQPCDACRLFGRAEVGGERASHLSALILGDALLEGEARPDVERHGVSLDRRSRSAQEGLLFNALLPAAGQELRFRAEGRLIRDTEKLFDLLKAAATLTTHIGGGQSRGMGRVELSVFPCEPSSELRFEPSAEHQHFEVVLERPANIGTPLSDDNMRSTRTEVPGAALRGAVGFGLAELLGESADTDQAFQTLVDAERGAIFDFLYLCGDGSGIDGVVGPWPLTARACKHKPSEFAVDDFFARLAIALAGQDVEMLVRAQRLLAEKCGCCGAPLKPRRLLRGQHTGVKTRTVTRIARDRTTRSAKEKMLFSIQLLQEETRFVGSVRRVPPREGESNPGHRLTQGLALPLSLGRGRSLGWGRIKLSPIRDGALPDLQSRRSKFEAQARETLDGFPSRKIAAQLVPLTCLTPLLLEAEDDGTAALAEALGVAPEACCLKVRRFGLENGWDQRAGLRMFQRSVKAGSVFLFKWTKENEPLLERLSKLEMDGVGDRTVQGFGRVLAFDPAFCNPVPDAAPLKDKNNMEDRRIRELVLAAERVIDQAFKRRDIKGKLSKSQLSQLVGVTQEAVCHEEVSNYLRYQCGRRSPSWTLQMVSNTIETFEKIVETYFGESDRMELWRRYATYMSRRFTYMDAVNRYQRTGRTA